MILLILRVVIFPCFSISCNSTEVYLKVSRQTKDWAREEFYEIWDGDELLVQSEFQTLDLNIH